MNMNEAIQNSLVLSVNNPLLPVLLKCLYKPKPNSSTTAEKGNAITTLSQPKKKTITGVIRYRMERKIEVFSKLIFLIKQFNYLYIRLTHHNCLL